MSNNSREIEGSRYNTLLHFDLPVGAGVEAGDGIVVEMIAAPVVDVVSNAVVVVMGAPVIGGAVVVSGQSYSSLPLAQSAFPSHVHRRGIHEVELHANSPGQLLSGKQI